MTPLTVAAVAFTLLVVASHPAGAAHAVTKFASSVGVFADSLGKDSPADTRKGHR